MNIQTVYSVCGMCTVRCPIMAEVKNGEVEFLQGNPHVPARASGAASVGTKRWTRWRSD